MTIKLIACIGAALLSSALLADSAVFVTSGQSAPSQNVILSFATNATGSASTGWHNSSPASQRDVGQTFVVNNATVLKSVTFRLFSFKSSAVGAEFSLSIYRFSDKGAYIPESESPVYTASGHMPETLADGAYLTFTLDKDVALDAGQYYGIVLSFVENASVALYASASLDANFGNAIVFGYSSTGETPAWGTRNTTALQMYAVTIPEPGMGAMSAWGGAFATAGMLARWRRRGN